MAELVYSPKQAADALGVSGAALRRAALAYEAAFGDLKRDARGARQFTSEAVERLRLAFATVHAGRVASVEVALTMLRDEGDLPVRVEPPTPGADDLEALARAVAEEMLAGLRADLKGLRDENAALRLEVAALRERVEGVVNGTGAQTRELGQVSQHLDRLTGAVLSLKVPEETWAALDSHSPAVQPAEDVDLVRLAVREELEGLRVRLHAAAPAPAQPAPRRGLLARLFGW